MASRQDRTALLLPPVAAALFGLCEWVLLRPDPAPGGFGTVLLPLLAVVALYGGFGLVVALAARLANRLRPPRVPPIDPAAATAAALLALAALARFPKDALAIVSALALGAATYAASSRGARRFPRGTTAALALGLPAVFLAALVVSRPGDSVARSGGTVPSASSPAVLLITIDTLRADRLGVYGYDAARTPHLDALAARGALFRDAVTHSPWTGPSHCSILTGLLPQTHLVRVNGMPLPAEIPTLADDLSPRGYRTGAFVSGWPLKEEAIRLASRFGTYSEGRLDLVWRPLFEYGSLTLFRYLQHGLAKARIELFFKTDRDASAVTSSALGWLEESAGSPFFAWVHYYDPHLPYEPPGAHRTPATRSYAGPVNGDWYTLDAATKAAIVSSPENLQQMFALYDAEIAFVDAELGRLLEAARRSAPPAGLLVVVTSDHGEDMGEHGHFFIRDLYEPTLRVPLIIVPPEAARIEPSVVDAQVGLVDLVPTILALLDVEAERPLEGRSIVAFMRDAKDEAPVPAISVLDAERREQRQESYAIRHEGWKLIHRVPGWKGLWWEPARVELYDLRADPGETRDLAAERPESVGRLGGLLRPYVTSNGCGSVRLDHDQIRNLRALGYLQ